MCARTDLLQPHEPATDHSFARKLKLGPEILLQKAKTPIAVQIKEHHPRSPDIGIDIQVSYQIAKQEKRVLK